MSENLQTKSNNEDIKSKYKAIVVYDTRFGNTEKVAEALTRGIQSIKLTSSVSM